MPLRSKQELLAQAVKFWNAVKAGDRVNQAQPCPLMLCRPIAPPAAAVMCLTHVLAYHG